ncbi:MAG TPA: hypothetical protein VFN68_09240 [Acidimicrobiales bacterium]|nr:hypothetical protein [Acidimicrobiales bacterium]
MLIEITRSARAAQFLTVGAALLVLQAALACVAYAVLTRSSLGASRDLATAAGWAAFVGLAAGLAAVAVTAWDAALGAGWPRGAELVAAVGASLLIVMGQLVVAANGANGSDAGSVVIAVGVGGWSALTLFEAGRRSIAERGGGSGRQSNLWLLASGSLLVLAVASGLPAPNGPGRALPIATAVLFLVAYAGLAATFEGSTRRGFMPSGRIRVLVAGLFGPGSRIPGAGDHVRVRVRPRRGLDHVAGGAVHSAVHDGRGLGGDRVRGVRSAVGSDRAIPVVGRCAQPPPEQPGPPRGRSDPRVAGDN